MQDSDDDSAEERAKVHGVHPDWLVAERVVARREAGRQAAFLVKWRGLPYAEATWEPAASLGSPEDHVRAAAAMQSFQDCTA